MPVSERRICRVLGQHRSTQGKWKVNHKRVERIWRREGLKVPLRQPKRGRMWLNDGSCIRLQPQYPGHYGLTTSSQGARMRVASSVS